MKRIHLTQEEKRQLRALAAGIVNQPAEPAAQIEFSETLRELQRKGLADARYHEDGTAADARVSRRGRLYLATYPSLRNPVNWSLVAQWLSLALAAFAAAAALFACARAGLFS